MVSLHPEYVVDEDKHTKAVILPVAEWKAVMAELEELRAYDAAKSSPGDPIPFAQAVREIREGYDL